MPKDPLLEARRILRKKAKSSGLFSKKKIEEYQRYWRIAGPKRFAEEVLTCPLDVPRHPDFNREEWEKEEPHLCKGCTMSWGKEVYHKKFRNNGVPYHIILSEEQIDYLADLAGERTDEPPFWINGVMMSLVAAARGAGKTFIFAIWDTWQIMTQDRWQITCMGGSSKQSKIIQGYINDWRIDIKMVEVIIYRSLRGIDRYCITVGRSKCDFPACSTTAARGPHVNEVQIDEACEAEDKSEDGAKAVAAVQWQTTGKREGRIQLSSTAHYIHGSFYEYMTNPDKYGFKVYRWAIAKHISGEKDPYKIYTDKDPQHWLPNVWWLTKDEIEKKRRSKSDEEWLCEALGGASMASGAVFKKKDLDIIICGMCENCEPYKWGHCKLIEMANLGTKEDPIKQIIDRRGGFDYGVSDAPCALTIMGRKKNFVFILWNDEQLGLREEEKEDWVYDNLITYNTWTLIPDPNCAGKGINEKLEDREIAIYIIPADEKGSRVYNVINFVEKHKMVIPKAFWYLTQSMRRLAWKNNKIRKIGDHSFDTLQYGMEDWSLEGDANIMEEFLKRTEKKTNKREGGKKPKLGIWSLDSLLGEKKKPPRRNR